MHFSLSSLSVSLSPSLFPSLMGLYVKKKKRLHCISCRRPAPRPLCTDCSHLPLPADWQFFSWDSGQELPHLPQGAFPDYPFLRSDGRLLDTPAPVPSPWKHLLLLLPVSFPQQLQLHLCIQWSLDKNLSSKQEDRILVPASPTNSVTLSTPHIGSGPTALRCKVDANSPSREC